MYLSEHSGLLCGRDTLKNFNNIPKYDFWILKVLDAFVKSYDWLVQCIPNLSAQPGTS